MSNLLHFGTCCAVLSVWGIVQLSILGILYLMEPVTLFDEAQPGSDKQFNNYEEFKTVVKEGYRSVALNCFLAAGIYLITFFLSMAALKKARKDESRALIEAEEEEFELKPKSRHHQQSLDMSEPLPTKPPLSKTA